MTTPQTPGSPSSAVGDRERFEAWAIEQGYAERARHGLWWINGANDYHMFQAWQAALAAISAPAAEQQHTNPYPPSPGHSLHEAWKLGYRGEKPPYAEDGSPYMLAYAAGKTANAPAIAAPVVQAAEQQAGVPATAIQALEALDELESSARGDEPFNHFAAPLIRQFIESTLAPSPAHRAQQAGAGLGEPVLCVSSKAFKQMKAADDHIKAWLPPTTSAEDMPLYTADALRAKVEPCTTAMLQKIVDMSAGWDDQGSTGPIAPLSWESVGRVSMDIARALLALQGAKLADAQAPADLRLSSGYISGTCVSAPDGATVRLHYSEVGQAEAAFMAITENIDAALAAPIEAQAPREPS